jgi:endonuclease/exonuclease/phosphatase family metal-dependent hydrolase
MQLTVATYNIHKGLTGWQWLRAADGTDPAPAEPQPAAAAPRRLLDGLRRRLPLRGRRALRVHELAQALALLDADLVFLQEVQHSHQRHAERYTEWPDMPQSEFLAEPLGYHHAYESNAVHRHGEYGNALLSRFPVLDSHRQEMSDHRFERRGLLHVRLSVPSLPGGVLHAVVLHLGLLAASRTRQVAIARDTIAERIGQGEAVIVAGDFNDWQNRIAPHHLGAGFVNAVPERAGMLRRAQPTFPARLPLLPLDRICARGFAVLPQPPIEPRAWRQLSDHMPLVARLQWPAAAPTARRRAAHDDGQAARR